MSLENCTSQHRGHATHSKRLAEAKVAHIMQPPFPHFIKASSARLKIKNGLLSDVYFCLLIPANSENRGEMQRHDEQVRTTTVPGKSGEQ